jgi:hypothetical protein
MRNCLKCGVPRAAESLVCSACYASQPHGAAARPHLTVVACPAKLPRVSASVLHEVRPFVIAGFVFLMLLVGSRIAAGYYAARAAMITLPQTMADTVPKSAEAPATVSLELRPKMR